jgi:lipopolysaccharide transport system permease protein
MPNHLPQSASRGMLDFNPFFHLISVVRNPLLGEVVTATNWAAAIGIAVVGWTIGLLLLNKYRARIAYWL